MAKKLLFTFFIFSFLSATQLIAQRSLSADEINTLKNEVKKTATKTQSITSDFTQYKHLDFLDNDIITQGKLAFKKPNWVKWEYTKPYKYSVVFKDNSLKVNDDGKKSQIKVGSSKLFQKMNGLIVKSINGDMFDDEEFEISYQKNKSGYAVTFATQNAEFKKYIAAFELIFNTENYDVQQVTMFEPSGDYTKIVFKNRVLNAAINDDIFAN